MIFTELNCYVAFTAIGMFKTLSIKRKKEKKKKSIDVVLLID